MAVRSTSPRAGVALGSLVAGYLLIALVAGAPDSPLVPPLPPGVSSPGWASTGAGWLGLDRLSRSALTGLSVALLAAVLAAFLVVVIESRRRRAAPALVLAAVGLSLALSVAAPVVLSRDVYSYAIYGRIFSVHHANPYVRTPSSFPADPFVSVASPAWVDTRAVYGPAFVLTAAGVARVWSDSSGGAILALKVLAGVGAAVATLLAAWAARPFGRAALAAAAIGLNPVMVVHTVGGAHNDALIAACLAGALFLALSSLRPQEPESAANSLRSLGVTMLLTLAGLIKVILFPVLLVWLWVRFRAWPADRRWVRAALHTGAAIVISLAFAAPFMDSARALGSLATLASVEGWASPARLVARGARALGNTIDGSATANVMGKLVVVAFLGLFAWAIVRFLRRREPLLARPSPYVITDPLGVCALGLALSIPYLLPWYAAWFLPFLVLISDDGLMLIGFAAAGLLALTGVPAEAGSAPGLWRDAVLGVHYGVAPLMFALYVAWVARVGWEKLLATNDIGGIPRMADHARP
jgi:alpha-1,6-mannosyltransferase